VYEAWWVSVPVWTFRRREKLLLLPRIEPQIYQPIVIYAIYAIRVHFKMNLAEVRWAGTEGIHLAQDPFQRRGLVNSDKSSGCVKFGEFYYPAEQLPAFQEGPYLIQLV